MKTILMIMSAVCLCACTGTTPNAAKESGDQSKQQDTLCVKAGIAESVQAIDWSVVMPEIVSSLPKETVHEFFHGRIEGKGTYDDNSYLYYEDYDDTHYEFNMVAAPIADSDELFVVANSIGGMEGCYNLLIKSMRYNPATKAFTDISDNLPGVSPSADMLNLDWLGEHPDWAQRIKDTYKRFNCYYTSSVDGAMMVKVEYNDLDLCYDIDEAMASDVPDWNDRLSIVYEWNGHEFCHKK